MKKLTIITLVIITLSVIAWVFARPMPSAGDCMEPAIMTGQLLFVNQTTPYIGKYRINDIITFKHENKLWYSRIVALENDTIEITQNNIMVHNKPAETDSIKRNWTDWKSGTYAIDKPFTVPPHHVYVLSDNLAANHDDSRHFGPIAMDNIMGTVWQWR